MFTRNMFTGAYLEIKTINNFNVTSLKWLKSDKICKILQSLKFSTRHLDVLPLL